MRCMNCGGPFHPSTGHAFSVTAVLCGPCARDFFAWVRKRMTPRKKGPDFGVAAASSVRPV